MKTIIFFILNLFLLKNHLLISSKIKIYDLNSKKKISLLGGIFLILNISLAYALFYFEFAPYEHFYKINVIFLIFAVFIVGFVDDKIKINPSLRLFIIILILFLFLQDKTYLIQNITFSFFNNYLFVINNDYLSTFFTIFCFLCFLNALNFMDGINLQVILYSIGCFVYFITIQYSWFLFILILSLIFFSYLNFKNRSFLGDSGVYILAIVISLCAINLHNKNLLFADQIIFLFLLPGLELIRLFLERIYNKKNPLLGDHNHIHHLIKNKIKKGVVYIIIFVSFMPIILYELNMSKLLIFLSMFSVYSIMILYFKK